MGRRQKSVSLKHSTRLAIVQYKRKNPGASLRFIADNFNVTYNQAKYAVEQDKLGKLLKTRHRSSQKVNTEIEVLKDNCTADELLERQYHTAIATLEKNSGMAVDERISLLDKLFDMRKILQQVRLESHIRRTDAGIIALIVKRFIPEATEEDIIKIYREAAEQWKIEQK